MSALTIHGSAQGPKGPPRGFVHTVASEVFVGQPIVYICVQIDIVSLYQQGALQEARFGHCSCFSSGEALKAQS